MATALTIAPTSPVPLDTEIPITVTFSNDAGTPTNPSEVTLSVLAPNGNLASYSGGNLTNPGAGQYGYDLTVTQSGVWVGNWQGTGNIVATSGDFSFIVEQSIVLPG